jgi:hypothetical protein
MQCVSLTARIPCAALDTSMVLWGVSLVDQMYATLQGQSRPIMSRCCAVRC